MGDRHKFRATWHDYNGGVYFVTICAYEKKQIFGRIIDNIFIPTKLGDVIKEHISNFHSFYEDVEILNSVIMPNHIHLVISVGTRLKSNLQQEQPTYYSDIITHTQKCFDPNEGTRLIAPEISDTNESNAILSMSHPYNNGCLKPPRHVDPVDDFHHNSRLAVIVGSFKAGITRTARTRRIASLQDCIWQSRYHEHLIRHQQSYIHIMNYIDTNVENWSKDCFAN